MSNTDLVTCATPGCGTRFERRKPGSPYVHVELCRACNGEQPRGHHAGAVKMAEAERAAAASRRHAAATAPVPISRAGRRTP